MLFPQGDNKIEITSSDMPLGLPDTYCLFLICATKSDLVFVTGIFQFFWQTPTARWVKTMLNAHLGSLTTHSAVFHGFLNFLEAPMSIFFLVVSQGSRIVANNTYMMQLKGY